MPLLSFPSLDSVNYTLALLSIIALGLTWWSAGRSKRRIEAERAKAERMRAEAQAERQEQIAGVILGTPAVTDATGAILVDEQPGLGARTKTLEEAVSVLLVNDTRITNLETASAEHGASIAALLADKWERGATAALDAVKKQQADTIDEEPT